MLTSNSILYTSAKYTPNLAIHIKNYPVSKPK